MTFKSKASVQQSYGGTVVAPMIVTDGSNQALLVSIFIANGTDRVVSVVRGGQAFTRLNANLAGLAGMYDYILLNPIVGTANVVGTFTSGDITAAMIVQLHDNVLQSAPIASEAHFTMGYPTTSESLGITPVLGGTIVDSIGSQPYTPGSPAMFAPSGGQTLVDSVVIPNYPTVEIASSYKVASSIAATSMAWTNSAEIRQPLAHSIYCLAPAVYTPPAVNVPAAPIIGAATVTSSTAVSVAGTAPTNNGGAVIDLYRATASPSGVSGTSATLPVPVPGLATGSAQTFRLEAHNSAGWSSMSSASNSATPSAANQAPVFGGTYANVYGTIGSALSAPAATSNFTDTDTLTYTKSPAGTAWPAGSTINAATGMPGGTPTGSAATTSGCKIRATDPGGLYADSNAFNFVIAAASVPGAAGSFITRKLGNNTATGWAAGTAVAWEWRQGWRIGAAATSSTFGTGVLASDGTLTMTGLPSGAGVALVAVRGATYDLDKPFMQPGVVA